MSSGLHRQDDVLDFWFDADRARIEWFRKSAAFDDRLRERFAATIEAALRGELAAWAATPRGALARLIVLDQFTRNAFRDTPRAFAGDAQALAAARDIVARRWDRDLRPVQRQFVYLPFEHAEDIDSQNEALRLFAQLAEDAPELSDLLGWAQRHHAVIASFGRFPHRNALLGRASTAEELEFLRQPGSRF